jgi:hypothetical protein
VRLIALPARVCVPFSRTGAADAASGDIVVGRNSVSMSGLLTADLLGAAPAAAVQDRACRRAAGT